ncbi:unnamed protein product [Sphagnum tenellum]
MQRVCAPLCKTGDVFTNMQEDRLAARMHVLRIQAADPDDQKLADGKSSLENDAKFGFEKLAGRNLQTDVCRASTEKTSDRDDKKKGSDVEEIPEILVRSKLLQHPATGFRFFLDLHHAAIYYAQRTTPGGLLIAEATAITEGGNGYPCAPGIWTREQVEAWKPVVKAVHYKGGYFFCQIWHVGHVSHTAYQPNGAAPVSLTTKRFKHGQVTLLSGKELADYSTPKALTTDEIPQYVELYCIGPHNAIDVGH